MTVPSVSLFPHVHTSRAMCPLPSSASIVALGPLPFSPEIHDELRALGAHVVNGASMSEAAIAELIEEADIVVTDRVRLTARVLQGCARLRYVVASASQAEWLETDLADAGIELVLCPGYATNAVAEYVFAALLTIARQLAAAASSLREGQWRSGQLRGFELAGRSLTVIGCGRIGGRVCELASALGMRTASATSRSSETELDLIVSAADVLVLAMPSTPLTRHLLDARRISLMKPAALIVNVGRGDALDHSALLDALDRGDLGGAVLDVFEGEPLAGEPSAAIIRLAGHPGVYATPHIAYDTVESNQRLARQLVSAVAACLKHVEESRNA